MVNHTGMAKQFSSLNPATRRTIPQREQTDLRFSLFGPDDGWDLSLFATNITNEDEFTIDCSGFGNPVCFTFQQPRTIGLEFTLRR